MLDQETKTHILIQRIKTMNAHYNFFPSQHFVNECEKRNNRGELSSNDIASLKVLASNYGINEKFKEVNNVRSGNNVRGDY